MKLFVLVFLAFISVSGNAKDFNNGCGSGWNEKFVPDKIYSLGIDFSQSCGNHDNCYSKCLEGGENFNKLICKQSAIEQTEGRRQVCDATFLFEMKKTCEKKGKLKKAICLGASALYAVAVRKGGAGSFNGMEVPTEYFDFIMSERAQDFDFSNFVTEVNQIQNIDGVALNNKLIFSMRQDRPIVKFIGIDSEAKYSIKKNGKFFQTDLLIYGSVDLTNAYNKNAPLTIENIDIKNLTLEKLKIERHFSITKP